MAGSKTGSSFIGLGLRLGIIWCWFAFQLLSIICLVTADRYIGRVAYFNEMWRTPGVPIPDEAGDFLMIDAVSL
jgi:hypothetical protein